MKQNAGSKLKLRHEACCRLCGSARNLTQHHLIPRHWWRANLGFKGRNDPRNLIPLCLYCHAAVDGHLSRTEMGRQAVLKRQQLKRMQLRHRLAVEEIDWVCSVLGVEWLNHHYPVFVRTDS